MEKKQHNYLRFIIAFIIISIICVAITLMRLYLAKIPALQSWSDGFSLSGILFICFGGLVYTSSEGAFDGFTYATKQMWHLMKKTGTKYPYTYSEYKAIKHTKEYHFSHIFLSGLIFLAIGIVLIIINSNQVA